MTERRIAALAVAALLSAAACDGGDATSGATTTSSPDRTSSSTTTSAPAATPIDPAHAVSGDVILAGVAAGSADGATRLPEDRWIAGVRTGCADLPVVPDDQIDEFFELFRVQVENIGGTREQSRAAVLALVGGFGAACPDLAVRLAPLVPAS